MDNMGVLTINLPEGLPSAGNILRLIQHRTFLNFKMNILKKAV
jgi:hypothetical protein